MNDEEEGVRADLQFANLQDADLRKADLRNANLWGADLRDADLRNANLRGANLQDADLRRADLLGADLRNADLDFSCWPLWRGAKNIKVNKKIYTQLLAHICAVDVDDDECKANQKLNLKLASKSHIAKELGIEVKE